MPFAKILREEETLNIWESEKKKKKRKLCALMKILKGITVIKYDCEEIIIGGPFTYIFGHIIV